MAIRYAQKAAEKALIEKKWRDREDNLTKEELLEKLRYEVSLHDQGPPRKEKD